MNKLSFLTLLLTATFALSLSGCTKVGSEAWCEKIKETPKGDWTANEATDYAKHCIFK
ncbi:MAG: DUF3012 domain-containing protein [Porticoccus sp.]|nr:DUF3012 domain-containing protein [Porticoccus sp.]PCJ91423.1 MAG: hypothetical protein COA46_08245 [Porticoccaceae bacterium]